MELDESQYQFILENLEAVRKTVREQFQSLEDKIIKSVDVHLERVYNMIREHEKAIGELSRSFIDVNLRLSKQETKSIVLEHSMNVIKHKQGSFPWFQVSVILLIVINIVVAFLY